MNVAAAVALTAAAIAILAGAMSLRLSLAPGWRDQSRFSLVAFSAAAYALCNLGTTLGLPDPVVVAASRFQVAFAACAVFAWVRYSEVFAGSRPGRAARALPPLLLTTAALAAVPGVAFSGLVVSHPFAPFGTVYRDAVPTAAGYAAFVVIGAGAVFVLVRFARAWRAGVRHAALHTSSLAALFAFGVNDAFATTGQVHTPYLLDTGFVLPIVAVYWSLTTRFVEGARTLAAMHGKLEGLVEARTRELAEAHAALHQAEKLAGLGRFANGVAHEVNNPASVVTANLHWLAGALASRETPAPAETEAAEIVRESLQAMQRINGLVRKLADAGRISVPVAGGSAPLAEAAAAALAVARERAGGMITFVAEVPERLFARARPENLTAVLEHLLANAADAVPAGRAGHVTLRAERRDGRVRVVVEDDGRGMAPDVLRRAFDPFFTTKPEGQGAGLGLAVARGLVEGHGGALWLESVPGEGTRAIVELPEAEIAAPPERT